jgi:AGZA family xanthine/uracil permease-like MFS transporter
MEAIASFFKLRERGTTVGIEVRAGLATFMVMAYILIVNPLILSAGPLAEVGPPFQAVVVGTALAAGLLTIAMGMTTNYPFAIAAGLGLNAVVAFELILNRGFAWQEAMAIVVWEGIIILLLVLTGLREAVMAAIPMNLKRAIAVGIGLFILFIGLFNGGLVVDTLFDAAGQGPPVAPGQIINGATFTFIVGLLLAIALLALRVRGALIITIIGTTIVAIVVNAVVPDAGFAPGTAQMPDQLIVPFTLDNFATIFQPLMPEFLFGVFTHPEVPLITVVLVIFSLMMADFFDTMGTVIGVGEQAGFLDERGRLPGIRNVLVVDSLGAAVGGAFGVSSNTTYIESAAGVSEGGRTGLTAVVVGVLFLAAILVAPIALIVPAQAAAPALVVVGFLMFTIARDFDWSAGARSALAGPEEPAQPEQHDRRAPGTSPRPEIRVDELFPVLITLIVMPLTFSITEGIAAGFVTYVFLKLVTGRWRDVHPLMWVAGIAFVLFFAVPWLQLVLGGGGG